MRRTKLLIGAGITIVLPFSSGPMDQLVSGPVIRMFGDSMDWRSRWLIGRHGIDCGKVEVNADPKVATDAF